MTNVLKKTTVSLLVIALLAPHIALLAPQQAHAQGGGGVTQVADGLGGVGTVSEFGGVGVGSAGAGAGGAAAGGGLTVSDIGNFIVNKLSAVSGFITSGSTATTAANSTTLVFKEFVLDPTAYTAARLVIRLITRSIVDWINSGFDGNPSFVDDLGGYLATVADEIAGDFIQGAGLGFVCEPFRANIQFSLSIQYFQQEEEEVCTLTGIIDNINGFFNDFNQGGWDAWFSLTTRPHNNPYGSFLIASSRLDARIRNAKGEEIKLLDFGRGFFSFETCDDEIIDADGKEIGSCTISTPGSLIEEGLVEVFGTDIRQLELADEFNEIVGALVGQLLTQAFTSGGGFRGLSRSSPGRPSFTSRLAGGDESELNRLRSNVIGALQSASRPETAFKTENETALASAESTKETLEETAACYLGKLEDEENDKLFLTDAQIETAKSRAASATSTIASNVQPVIDGLQQNVNSAENNLRIFDELITLVAETNSVSTIQEAAESLSNAQRNGTIRNSTDVARMEIQRGEIVAAMNDIGADAKLEECLDFPPATAESGDSTNDGDNTGE